MKLKKFFCVLLSSSVFICSLSGCSNSNIWNYSKDDAKTFIDDKGTIGYTTNEGEFAYSLGDTGTYLKDQIDKNQVLLFNYSKLQEEINNEGYNGDDYFSYNLLSKYRTNVSRVAKDNTGTYFVFNGNENDLFGLLIWKSATKPERSIISLTENNAKSINIKDVQTDFEEKYLKSEAPKWNDAKTIINIIGGIAQIATGVGSKTPTAISAGIFSILTGLGDLFFGRSGPTIVDVMNKLVEISAKLDAIDQKITANHNQLLEEIIRVQAAVDKNTADGYERDITSFNTDFIMPLNDIKRNLSDYIAQSYKLYVQEPKTLDLYYSKDTENNWQHHSIADDISGLTKFTISINNFSNAKAFLASHNNVVANGFMDELNKDIDLAVSQSVSKPDGLKDVEYRNHITEQIGESFTKIYYETNHDKALDVKNKTINFAYRLIGKDSKSIITAYVERLKYIYNFAIEGKDMYRSLLCNLLAQLDSNLGLGSAACIFAGINQVDLGEAYEEARKAITETYKALSELPDNYCYQTKALVKSGFYQVKDVVSFTDTGNHPTFHQTIQYKHVYTDPNNGEIKFVDDNINNHTFVNEVDNIRIATRWRLMIDNGLVKSTNYIDYLINTKVLSKDDLQGYKDLIYIKGWITTDAMRIFTGLTSRSLNDGDKSLYLTCTAKGGKSGSDYFYVNWQGYYGNTEDKREYQYWSGTIYETTYIDGNTGLVDSSQRKVCAYARYSEAHTLWINDEYWAFVDNPVGNYFFSLEYINV